MHNINLKKKCKTEIRTKLHTAHGISNTTGVIKSRRITKLGHVARGGGGEREGKRPIGRPRCRWEDNITMDIKAIGLDGADWNNLVEDRNKWWAVVNTVMNLRGP